MSLDLTFVHSIVSKKLFLNFRGLINPREHFEDIIAQKIWEYVDETFQTIHAIPSADSIAKKFDIELPPAEDDPIVYFKELRERLVHTKISELGRRVEEGLRTTSAVDTLYLLRNESMKLVSSIDTSDQGKILDEGGKERLSKRYADYKAGKGGIQTPWPTVNKWTRGFFPKDMSVIVGRTGTGKSWWLVVLAEYVVSNICDTCFISCEMSDDDIEDRYVCVRERVAYGSYREGKLSFGDEQRLLSSFDHPREHNFTVFDASQGLSMNRIEAIVASTPAPLVVIDSAYRIEASRRTRDRFENMAEVMNEIKKCAQIYNKAIVISTQFNRGATQKEAVDLSTEDIAMSDVIGWNSTNILALAKERDEYGYMNFKAVKVRENNDGGKPLRVNWNFVQMSFTEAVQENYSKTDKRHKKNEIDEDSWGPSEADFI